MKRLSLFLFFMIGSVSLSAQSNIFQKTVDNTRQDVFNNGYSILDEGEVTISYDNVVEFEVYTFYPGEYYIAVIVENCRYCEVEIITQDTDSGKVFSKFPNMTRRGSIAAAGYPFKQSKTGRGRIQVSLKKKTPKRAFAMLLKR